MVRAGGESFFTFGGKGVADGPASFLREEANRHPQTYPRTRACIFQGSFHVRAADQPALFSSLSFFRLNNFARVRSRFQQVRQQAALFQPLVWKTGVPLCP